MIQQIDGNCSLSSTESCNISNVTDSPNIQESKLPDGLPIQILIGNKSEDKFKSSEKRASFRKTLRRDNRGELGLYLPNIAVYNHRSIWKKYKSFCTEFTEMSMGAAFHSEVWEQKESPQFVIIMCAVYSPPRSKIKSKLIDFISNTYNYLKSTKY